MLVSDLRFMLAAADAVSLGSKMKEAAGNLVVGMVTVFAVLIFIAWIISLFKYIGVFQKKAEERRNNKTGVPADAGAENTVSAASADNGAAVTAAAAAADADSEELAAVMAAAIAAYEADGCKIEKQHALANGISVRPLKHRK